MDSKAIFCIFRKLAVLWLALVSCFPANSQSTSCPPLNLSDTSVCIGDTVFFSVNGAYQTYQWSPSTGLSNPNVQNPYAVITESITYILTATNNSENMVQNSDFSQGNTGFTSGMNYTSNYSPGNYFVGPQFFTLQMASIVDHTPSNDNYFMSIDGASSAAVLWEATFAVDVNTDYDFGFWGSRADAIQPIYEVVVNGNNTGTATIANFNGIPYSGTWTWDEYAAPTWNSGSNTQVTVSIWNLETQGYGNDFGLDDIYLLSSCSISDTVQITLGTSQVSTSVLYPCWGDSIALTANSTGPHLWSNNDTAQSIIHLVTDSVVVSVTSGETGSCLIIEQFNLEPRPLPNVEIEGPNKVCLDASIQLAVSTIGQIKWSTGDTNETLIIQPLNAQLIIVDVTDSFGCLGTDSVFLTVFQQHNSVDSITSCRGQDLTIIAPVGSKYLWNTGDSSRVLISQTNLDAYNLIFTDTNGCLANIHYEILLKNSFSADIDGPDSICYGSTLKLASTGGEKFLWSTGDTSSHIAFIPEEGLQTIQLWAADSNGCEVVDTLLVYVGKDINSKIFIPNVLTPNGDEINDKFCIQLQESFDCTIYNRWGILVGYLTPSNPCWEGRSPSASEFKSGVYFYHLSIYDACGGMYVRSGDLHLLSE